MHEVTMREAEGFQPHFATLTEMPASSVQAGAFLQMEGDGRLKVRLIPSPFGIPHRKQRPPAVRIERGEWLRWQVNYRFAGLSGGKWTYRLDTLNVVNGPASTNIFIGAPTRHVDECAILR
ncbi:MAG TPA: hypothetical protein VHG10_06485 [Glycomyces sp.]|nr:hypothetical protein [Glycomyces sp.]